MNIKKHISLTPKCLIELEFLMEQFKESRSRTINRLITETYLRVRNKLPYPKKTIQDEVVIDKNEGKL